MKELRLHRSVYGEAAVAEAVSVFAGYADLERADDEGYFVVRVSAATPGRERRVAGELGNYALGTTVRDLGAR